MKTKISSFLLVTTLLLSGFAGVSTLSAKTTPTSQNILTPDDWRTAAPYYAPLFVLEDTAPIGSQSFEDIVNETVPYDDTKSVAFAASGGFITSLLNLASRDDDYLGLYKNPNVQSAIDDNPTTNSDGSITHHYTCHPDQLDKTLGYLSCFDITAADALASSTLEDTSYYDIYNNIDIGQLKHKKHVTLTLGYECYSSNTVPLLNGMYYGSKKNSKNYISISNSNSSGDNIFYLQLAITFNDNVTPTKTPEGKDAYADVYDYKK